MILTGITDEAGALIDTQIKAVKELGWNTIEARSVEVEGFPKANLHDIADEAFDLVEMGDVAYKSGIQFRLLNRSRGPAVRGPRTQSDRSLYRKYMQQKLLNYCNLSVFSDPVIKFIFDKNTISGFETKEGKKVLSYWIELSYLLWFQIHLLYFYQK